MTVDCQWHKITGEQDAFRFLITGSGYLAENAKTLVVDSDVIEELYFLRHSPIQPRARIKEPLCFYRGVG